jgi:hypothetical protein
VSETAEEEFDAEKRELCSDGACTGVIGDDGKCRECGQKSEGSTSGEAAAASEPASDSEAPEADFKAERGEHVFEDDQRALCSDGACIGLLNSQGVCKVCGKSASS